MDRCQSPKGLVQVNVCVDAPTQPAAPKGGFSKDKTLLNNCVCGGEAKRFSGDDPLVGIKCTDCGNSISGSRWRVNYWDWFAEQWNESNPPEKEEVTEPNTPCLHCQEKEGVMVELPETGEHYVRCDNCDLRTGRCDTREEALSAWAGFQKED